jgi:hypothetical protein
MQLYYLSYLLLQHVSTAMGHLQAKNYFKKILKFAYNCAVVINRDLNYYSLLRYVLLFSTISVCFVNNF